METVVLIIMMLVGFSFVMKLGFHTWKGIALLSAVAAFFVGMNGEFAAHQSKTQIADWLQQPELMLDTSVILTVDVFFQVAFCVLMCGAVFDKAQGRVKRILLAICKWIPGLLIFPVLFSLLVEIIFAMPGTDFTVLGWSAAALLLAVFPLLAVGIRWLLPEPEIRLELMFLVNAIIAALGVVTTVNGRTAVAGTDSVESGALAGVLGLLLIGALAGFFVNKIITRKKITHLS